jgi:hypothetical protein
MRSKNITFFMPQDLIEKVQSIAGKRGASKFVVRAVERAVEEEMNQLRAAYLAANKDPDRIKTIEEWSPLDIEDWDEEKNS